MVFGVDGLGPCARVVACGGWRGWRAELASLACLGKEQRHVLAPQGERTTNVVVPGNAFKQLLDILIGLLARGPLIFFPAMDPDTPIRAEPQPSVLRWILGFLMGLSHLTICVGRVSD